MKPNKQNIINDILIELEKGIGYNDCLVVIGSKWKLPPTTYSRYWKTANEQHKINQDAIKKELTDISIDAEKQRLKKAILTKDQILERLTEIALMKAKKVDGQLIMPGFNDSISAMKTINEMQGYKAPAKLETTITEIKPLRFELI